MSQANSYTQFSDLDKVNNLERAFASAWSGISPANDLGTSHFSSSTQYVTTSPTSSGAFHMEIYSTNPDTDANAEVQYSIAYGHLNGSGSLLFDAGAGAETFSPSRAVYSQYRNLVYGGDETQNFTFDGHTPDHIYVININRARYKNALRMGHCNLIVSGTAVDQIKLTDDSATTSGSANAIRAGVGREFNLVSGSNGIRVGSSNTYVTDSGSYGYVYPDAGFIILNADALKLQNAIIAGGSFILDSQEDIASKFYFCRVRNTEFNYTTNDSFTTGTDGTLKYESMIDNPRTYITTVGLYNDNQDLLAVAKLSQPLPKDFTKEALIKVKLDY